MSTPFGSMAAAAGSSASSMFGGSGFGTTTTKPTTGFSSFGGTTATSIGGTGSLTFGGGASTFASTAPTFGSTAPAFGSTAPTFGSTVPTFGSTAPTFGSTAPTFGTGAPTFGSAAPTFGTNTLTTNTFGGAGALSTGSSFGSTFGQKPATSGFGGFGTGPNTTFGQQNQQPQQQQGPGSAHEALVAAVFNCSVFGDERDQALAKWNLLQAQWGTGQAYYSRTAPPLELNEQNPLCRFKAVGYSRLGSQQDRDGNVVMMFNKSAQEINTNKQALQTSLSNLFGNKPNLVVNIESVKAVTETKSQVLIHVVDKNANNAHISATELAAFMNAGTARSLLNGAGCGAVTAVTRPTPQALAQYLQTPPPGMDMRLWKQAQADNPDPDNYIPVPIVGFSEIKSRSRCQGEEASLQAEWLKRAADTLGELGTRRAAAAARLTQLSGKLHALRHTLLQAIGRKEVMGRVGAALSPEEEEARMRLHDLACTLSTPPLYNVSNIRKTAESSHEGSPRRSGKPELRYSASDWEADEALIQRKLDETQARVTQGENAIRWWVHCTAQWIEMWSKIRNETNEVRDDDFFALVKERNVLKEEQNNLGQQLTYVINNSEKLLTIGERIVSGELRRKGYVSPNEPKQRASLDSHKISNIYNVLANKLCEMSMRVDETCKSLQTEKDQNAVLVAKLKMLTAEIHNMKIELTHDDGTLGSTDSSHSEVERLQKELQDKVAAKQTLEEYIAEMKMEIRELSSKNRELSARPRTMRSRST